MKTRRYRYICLLIRTYVNKLLENRVDASPGDVGKSGWFVFARVLFLVVLVFGLVGTAPAATVKFAVFPSNDPRKLQTVMDTLADYLGKKTGDTVLVLVSRDYAELAERLREGSVDIAWINALNYVRIKAEIPTVQYIATFMETNTATGGPTPFYQSYILALKKSGLTTLADLRGKRFAFTDVGSASGYAYPQMLLRQKGIDADRYFRKVFFLKKHDRVLKALLAGSVDAGAVSDDTYFTAVRHHGDLFTILAKSAPIPLVAIVAAAHLPPETVARYRQALTAMPREHPFCRKMWEILGWSAAGFEVRDDAFYDSVRNALHP